jgi:hypothetical protein
VTTDGIALVLMVPFFGTVEVVTAAELLVMVVATEVVATTEVDAGAEVADEAGADVLDWFGGVIVTPFSAHSSAATWTAAVQYHESARLD